MWIAFAVASAVSIGGADILVKRHIPMGRPFFACLCVFSIELLVLLAVMVTFGATLDPTLLFDPYVVVRSAVLAALYVSGFFIIRNLDLSISAPLRSSSPVFALILGYVFLGEVLTFWHALAFVLIFGAQITFLRSNNKSRPKTGQTLNVWAEFAVLISVCSGIVNVTDKLFLEDIQGDLFSILIMGVLFRVVLSTGGWLLFERKHPEIGSTSLTRMLLPAALCAFTFVGADSFPLLAVSYPESIAAIVAITRRLSVVVGVVYGLLVLRETGARARLMGTGVMLVGLGLLISYEAFQHFQDDALI